MVFECNIQCGISTKRLGHIVLPHLLADEKDNKCVWFNSWRNTTSFLRTAVKGVKRRSAEQCFELNEGDYRNIFPNVNALLELCNKHFAFDERRQIDNNKVVLNVGQQRNKHRSVLDAKIEELRQKQETEKAQDAVEAEPNEAGRSAVDGISVGAESESSEKAFNVSFDELDDSDSADDGVVDELDGLDFDSGSVGGIRSAISSGTIALVVLLPIVIIALAITACFVLRRKRHDVKNDHSA
ncbi:hypothetical protein ERJ75_000264100 [Trypanosoma vivax]|nr:hypothetical protein ERJ75_000264100 [Trypanosoma vivax]